MKATLIFWSMPALDDAVYPCRLGARSRTIARYSRLCVDPRFSLSQIPRPRFATGPSAMKHPERIVIHDYFDVELTVVWSTVKNDPPKLEQQIEALLGQ
jgi:hypothetical protein